MPEIRNGNRVSVEYKGRKEEGVVYGIDKQVGIIVLQQPSTSIQLPHHAPRHNYKIFQLRDVQIKVLSKDQPIQLQKGEVNMDKLRTRERNAIRDKVMLAQQTNTQASEDAQRLFDVLCKTMPCQWQGEKILLLDGSVQIDKPYNAASVSGKDKNAVSRILKIMAAIK